MTTKPNPLLCMKTHLVYDNITVQLSKQNTRFQYKLVKKDSFKIYVSDVGLLCAKKEIIPADILFLSGNYYWASERSAEVDFIIQRNGVVIAPVCYQAVNQEFWI